MEDVLLVCGVRLVLDIGFDVYIVHSWKHVSVGLYSGPRVVVLIMLLVQISEGYAL